MMALAGGLVASWLTGQGHSREGSLGYELAYGSIDGGQPERGRLATGPFEEFLRAQRATRRLEHPADRSALARVSFHAAVPQ
jgi:hypothetical protein